MYESNKDQHGLEAEKETITELHKLDMEFCAIAMWVPSLRDVISRHIYNFINKGGSVGSNSQSGLTHFVVGIRRIENDTIVLNSIERSASKADKERTKPKIEGLLSMCAMCLRSIEEELQVGHNPINGYAEVGNRLKYLNLHQSVRTELYQQTEKISAAVQKVHRKAQAFVRRNVECPSSSKVHVLLNGDPSGDGRYNIDFDISDELFEQLRCELLVNCDVELEQLMSAVDVENVSELMAHWSILYSIRSKFEKIKRCRNAIVINNTRLIKREINKVLSTNYRYQDRAMIEQKSELCFAQTVTSLLEKIYKYIPDNKFSTFAVPYIKQECQNCLTNDDIVKLPPVYASKQAELLTAGIEIVDGKEVFNEDAALRAMRKKYDKLPWDSQTITDVRFKQSNKSTVSIHENDDDDEHQSLSSRLSCNKHDPEVEAGNSQWAEKIVGLLWKLPQVQRKRVVNKFGISESQMEAVKSHCSQNMTPTVADQQILDLLVNYEDK